MSKPVQIVRMKKQTMVVIPDGQHYVIMRILGAAIQDIGSIPDEHTDKDDERALAVAEQLKTDLREAYRPSIKVSKS